MACPATGAHDSQREGIRLGLIVAATTWLWIAVIDALLGQPFHTFNALGGILPFTVVHCLLCVAYGIVLISLVHSAERAPSVIFGLIFGGLLFEGAFAMMTTVIAAAANVTWLSIFSANLVAAIVAFALIARTHPLADCLRRGEAEH